MQIKRIPLAIAAVMAAAAPVAFADLPNGIAAGDVDQTSVVLWGRSDTVGALTFEYATDSSFSNVLGNHAVNVSDPLVPAKWDVSGLSAGTTYHYRVTDSVGASQVGTFNTAAALGTKTGLRFGVSGDWRGELLPYPSIKNADQRNLDFFVALGDTIYADVSSNVNGGQQQAQTLTEYRNKHTEVYSAKGGLNGLADLRQSTVTYALIDDHEVTNDFSGGADVSTDARFNADPAGTLINDSQLYNNGLQAFQDYNPVRTETYGATGDTRTAGELKLYRARTFGSDAAMFTLDARSFRDRELTGADPTSQASVGAFLASSFDPTRTMLGRVQVDDLKADLLAADNNGVTWKFVMVPEPIQNLGVIGAPDRFEGYAAERTEILQFIDEHEIDNVVFVAADIHGTLVNNLTYQLAPFTSQIATSAFEITTGAVAYDKPFGPTVLDLAATIPVAQGVTLLDVFLAGVAQQVGIQGLTLTQFNTLLPDAVRNAAIKGLIDQQITPLGYSPVGLEDSGLDVSLLQGGYAAVNTYGWTEFEIDPVTQALLVTTYGIPAYNSGDVAADLTGVVNRTPQIVSQFRVNAVLQPVPVPAAVWLFGSAVLGLARVARRRVA